MIHRYIQVHDAVTAALMTLARPDLIVSNEKKKLLEEYAQALEPFDQATVDMSAEKMSTLSRIIVTTQAGPDTVSQRPASAP